MHVSHPVAMQLGPNGAHPAEVELLAARRQADHVFTQLVSLYAHLGRPHPLAWTIGRIRTDAMKATVRASLLKSVDKELRAAGHVPSRDTLELAVANRAAVVWRDAEARLKEIAGLTGAREALAAAVAKQEAEIAAIGAETLQRSAPPAAPQQSPAQSLLETLRQRGVSVTVAAGKIVASPASALNAANIEAMRACKAELLALLRSESVEV